MDDNGDQGRVRMPEVVIDFQLMDIAHSRIFTEVNRADLLLQHQPNQDSQRKRAAIENYIEGLNNLLKTDYKRLKEAFG